MKKLDALLAGSDESRGHFPIAGVAYLALFVRFGWTALVGSTGNRSFVYTKVQPMPKPLGKPASILFRFWDRLIFGPERRRISELKAQIARIRAERAGYEAEIERLNGR